MEYPLETKILTLPTARPDPRRAPIRHVKIDLTDKEAATPKSAG
jgi:hypothetical protein